MPEATPIFAAMLPASGPPSRWRRARWLGFLLLMQAFHMFPLSDLVHRHYAVPAVVTILMVQAVFGATWVRANWLAHATTRGLRATLPWLIAVVVLGVATALVLGGQYKGLLIYVSIACAMCLPMRWVLPALAATTAIDAIAELRNRQYLGIAAGDQLGEVATGLSLVFFLGLMMWFYRRAMTFVIELRQAREELARLAVAEERLRFSRDLHDLLGHSLSTISLKSQLARRLIDPESPGANEVADIEKVAQQALTEVREAVTGYRRRSLTEELDNARRTLAGAGIEVSAIIEGTPLPSEVDTLLGWIVREGATNVLRHSHARSVDIRLRRTTEGISLDVRDNGVGGARDAGDAGGTRGAGEGGNHKTGGNGLAGLAERVAAAGGHLDAGPVAGRGFRLVASLPLPAKDTTAAAGMP